MHKVFIDGSAGTTGLRIHERLAARADIALLELPKEQRKDLSARVALMNESDVTFLCLPDAAAKEIAVLANSRVTLLDTSTAHRTAAGWAYGFPELYGKREALMHANRIAVPGCHASGFIAIAAPLVELGIAAADYPFSAFSITGYSGGGNSMIADYELAPHPSFNSPRQYALTQTHKHLPEMQAICTLSEPPIFSPIVANFHAGMAVSVPIHPQLLAKNSSCEEMAQAFGEYYKNEPMITVHAYSELPVDGFMAGNALAGSDALEIFVCGNASRRVIISRFDNLGKGSSGAAIQCMNLALGAKETLGLEF